LFALVCALSEVRCDVCPDCDFKLTDTYTDFAARHLEMGPNDGTCGTGKEKYIHLRSDFFQTPGDNGCCCLNLPPSAAITPPVCDAENPEDNDPYCVANLLIGRLEKVGEYFPRIAANQPDASIDGCCQPGTFKYIYKANNTGAAHDICNCVPTNAGFIN